jgi:hypothetical protein
MWVVLFRARLCLYLTLFILGLLGRNYSSDSQRRLISYIVFKKCYTIGYISYASKRLPALKTLFLQQAMSVFNLISVSVPLGLSHCSTKAVIIYSLGCISPLMPITTSVDSVKTFRECIKQ